MTPEAVAPGPSPGEPSAYDLFIIHADDPADLAFLRGALLPALGLPEERVMSTATLPLGMPRVSALARCVKQSKLTLVVVSPAFLADEWAAIAEDMASHWAVSRGRVVPLLRAPCELPLALDFLTKIDATDDSWLKYGVPRLRQELDAPVPEEPEVPCPYPGLRPYTEHDAAVLGGRDRERRELLTDLRNGIPELYVVGASGSGKTSLVVAGLLPKLRRPADPTRESPYHIQLVRPGESPHPELARAAAAIGALPTGTPALLVIDPLEEIFTRAAPDERAAFLAELATLRDSRRCQILGVVRADFYPDLLASALWPHFKNAKLHELPPLCGDALREAILAPASKVKVQLDPALIEDLLRDAGDEPGSLPLLGETLRYLWPARKTLYLPRAAYAELAPDTASGLSWALARAADAALHQLPSDLERDLARQLLLRLVQFGEGRAHTRRSRAFVALCQGEHAERTAQVIDHLVAHRILTVHASAHCDRTVALSHELLITAWPRLRTWVREHGDHEQKRRDLDARAETWHRHAAAGDPGGFFDDLELRELDRWWTPSVQALLGTTPTIDAFVAESREEVARLAAERAAAEHKQRELLARQYLAQAQSHLMNGRGAKAALYLVAARELGHESASLHLLWQWAQRALPVWLAPCNAQLLAWHPEGTHLAIHEVSALRVWDLPSRTSKPLEGCAPNPSTLLWSHDGRYLAAAAKATLQVWEPRRSARVLQTYEAARPEDAFARAASELRTTFSPLLYPGKPQWSPSRRYCAELRGGKVDLTASDVPRPKPPRTHDHVAEVAWAPRGELLAVRGADDGTFRVWNVEGAHNASPLFEPIHPVAQMAWRPDAGQLATVSLGQCVMLWDTSEAQREPTENAKRADAVASAAPPDTPSPCSALVARAEGKRVLLLDRHGSLVRVLDHKAAVVAVAWSGDGACLAAATNDQALRVWDPVAAFTLCPEVRLARPAKTLHWNADGTQLEAADCDSNPIDAWPFASDRAPLETWHALVSNSPYELVDGDLRLRGPKP